MVVGVTGFEPAASSSRTRPGVSAILDSVAAQCISSRAIQAITWVLRVCGLAEGSRTLGLQASGPGLLYVTSARPVRVDLAQQPGLSPLPGKQAERQGG